MAKLIVAVHLSVVRSWLRNFAPSIEAGIAELRDLLRIAIRGSLTNPPD